MEKTLSECVSGVLSLLLSLVPGAVLLRVNLNHGRATTLFSRTQRPPCTWFVHYIDMMSLTGAPYMPAAKFIAALAQWHKYGTQSQWVWVLGILHKELGELYSFAQPYENSCFYFHFVFYLRRWSAKQACVTWYCDTWELIVDAICQVELVVPDTRRVHASVTHPCSFSLEIARRLVFLLVYCFLFLAFTLTVAQTWWASKLQGSIKFNKVRQGVGVAILHFQLWHPAIRTQSFW